MKRLGIICALVAASLFARPARADGFLRTYVSGGPPPVEPLPGASPKSSLASAIWFCPSVGFDVFTIDLKTRRYVTGIVPGIGYGLKYKPAGWTATTAVVAVDLFVQATLDDNSTVVPGAKYFSIEALPIVTFLDWVSFGFGLDEYVGLSTLPSELHWVFSFGMKKST